MSGGGDWLPKQAPFELVRRGFSPDQVTAHLEQLEYDLRIATANRDATSQRIAELTNQLSTAQAEADLLRSQLDRQALEPLSVTNLSDRMQRFIRLAEEEAAEIRSTAATDATTIRSEATAEVEHLRSTTATELATARATAAASAADQQAEVTRGTEALAQQQRDFETEREQARTQVAEQVSTLLGQATAEAERIRTTAERSTSAALTSAKTEADRTVGTAKAESERTVGAANAEAERTLTEARAAATALTSSANAEADRTVKDAMAAAFELTEASKSEAARLDAESASRRQQVEEDFEITMASRRTEAHRTLTERERASVDAARRRTEEAAERSSRQLAESDAEARRRVEEATTDARRRVEVATAEARRRVEDATVEAHRRVAEADAAVTQLTDLRARLTGQLNDLHQHLGQIKELLVAAPGVIAPPDAEVNRVRAADFPRNAAAKPAPAAMPEQANRAEQIRPERGVVISDREAEPRARSGPRR